MKKIFIVFLAVIFLASCSVQERMSADLFIERLTKNCEDIFIKKIMYHNETVKICINDSKSKEYFIELDCDTYGNIYGISLIGDDEFGDFVILTKHIMKTYSPDISIESVTDKLFIDNFNFVETQWYYISSAKKDEILFFSIENKKLTASKTTDLTLKNNDIAITKGSE